MTTAVVILVALLAAATAFGLWRRRTAGRVRTIRGDAARPDTARLGAADGIDLGPRATLVEFSTAFCQPCRATRRILAEVADIVPGVAVVEVDAESNLDLVRRLGVLRTPTVLVLDSSGVVRSRAVGLPRKAEVVAAVGAVIDSP